MGALPRHGAAAGGPYRAFGNERSKKGGPFLDLSLPNVRLVCAGVVSNKCIMGWAILPGNPIFDLILDQNSLIFRCLFALILKHRFLYDFEGIFVICL